MKGVIDGMSKVMTYIEIQEVKDEMKNKEFYDKYGASTSVTVRSYIISICCW